MEKYTQEELHLLIEDLRIAKIIMDIEGEFNYNETLKQIEKIHNSKLKDIFNRYLEYLNNYTETNIENEEIGLKIEEDFKEFNSEIMPKIDISTLSKEDIIILMKYFGQNSFISEQFKNLDIEVQKDLIDQVYDLKYFSDEVQEYAIQNNPKEYFFRVSDEVQEKYAYLFAQIVVDENGQVTINDWNEKNEKLQEIGIKAIFENNNVSLFTKKLIWENTKSNVQENCEDLFIYLIEQKAIDTLVIEQTSSKVIESIINNDKIDENVKLMIWENLDANLQEQHVDLFMTIIEKHSNPNTIINMWNSTTDKIQEQNAELFIKIITEHESYLNENIISNTSKKVLRLAMRFITKDEKIENILQILKENPQISSQLDEYYMAQDENIKSFNEILEVDKPGELLNLIKKAKENNTYYLEKIWSNLPKDIQEEKLEDVIKIVKDNPEYFICILKNTNEELIKENLFEIYKIATGKEDIPEQLKILSDKNENLYKTLNPLFLDMAIEQGYTEEQILRITNYSEIQNYLLQYKDNKIMNYSIRYVLENDNNWILSLENKIRQNSNKYDVLLQNLSFEVNEEDIDEQFIQNFLSVISDTENYFDIKTADDIRNYVTIKNKTCKSILDGNLEDIPDSLKDYSKEELYKFALLEYKFGISLTEAKFIIERYGKDSSEILENNSERIEAQYLMALKTIIECENIEEVIANLKENELLEKAWEGFPNARNVEGQIINMFAELYNETLYKPKEEDKLEQQEIYIDKDEKEHIIDVYYINDDFNMNIRAEGVYDTDISIFDIENFIDFYNTPNIDAHGNCESYIGNDLIATIIDRNKSGIMVGYSLIRPNGLTASGPSDLGTANRDLSNYRENSEFRTPQQMKNNTRHIYNEMVKDRIMTDEDGKVQRYKPDYVVWIEEDTEEERKKPGWQEKRDKNPQWVMTKKAATQLGIPIVIIDREHFAKREADKIDLLQKLITGEEIDIEKYGKYIDQYKDFSKVELIKELITKYENNRVGLQVNEKLLFKYFSQDRFENIINNILSNLVNTISDEERKQILSELSKIANKESTEMSRTSTVEKEMLNNFEIEKEKARAKAFYIALESKCNNEIQNAKNTQAEMKIKPSSKDILIQLFKDKEITREDVQSEQSHLMKDVKEKQEKQNLQEQK